MQSFFKRFIVSIKGFIIGASMSVPGVSGGTMAIALGIYDKLLSAINNIRKDFKKSAVFLLKFGIPAGLALPLLYSLVAGLLEDKYCLLPVCALFVGAILGGIPALFQKIKPEKKITARFCVSSVTWGILGVAVVLVVANIMPILKSFGVIDQGVTSLVATTGDISLANVLLWVLTGLVISIALILPGISTTHMLLILGIHSITELGIGALMVIGLSLLAGIFGVTKPLEWALNRFTNQTYCVILGFVMGSLWTITSDASVVGTFQSLLASAPALWQWCLIVGIAVLAFVGGLFGLLYLSRFSEE